MTAEKTRVLVVMLIAVLSVSLGEALLAKGMKLSNSLSGSLAAQIVGIARNGYVISGTLLMALFYILYSLALRWADLSFVLPVTALSYLLGAFLARYFLGEAVSPTRWMGVLIITLGVIVVGIGESRKAPEAIPGQNLPAAPPTGVPTSQKTG